MWKEGGGDSPVSLPAIVISNEQEDLNHLFLVCIRAKSFWDSFAYDEFRKGFHILSFTDWLCWNLKRASKDDDGPWRKIFGTCLLWIWKWRNNEIFNCKEEVGLDRKVAVVRASIWEFLSASSKK